MRVAVTGASGFIGRHIVAELCKRQIDVVCVGRHLAQLKILGSGLHCVEMDIACPGVDSFARLERPDVLIHLAWSGLPNYQSLHHFEKELPQHYTFLKSLVEGGLPALIVAGTCFEYGMQSGELAEELMPCPVNPYGYAKDSLHRQLTFLKSSKPFNLTWGRLFYMYGDGQAHSSLFSQIKEAVLRSEKVFNMSGGQQLRDYLPVQDVAKKMVQLALLGNDFGAVNICSGKPISVRGLVEQWMEENGWEIRLNLGYYPYPNYEPMAFWGRATRCQDLLQTL